MRGNVVLWVSFVGGARFSAGLSVVHSVASEAFRLEDVEDSEFLDGQSGFSRGCVNVSELTRRIDRFEKKLKRSPVDSSFQGFSILIVS